MKRHSQHGLPQYGLPQHAGGAGWRMPLIRRALLEFGLAIEDEQLAAMTHSTPVFLPQWRSEVAMTSRGSGDRCSRFASVAIY